ncbi:holo-ACP synthase [bacterium]|nr:holo-ACP synthase [bacterium]
MIFGTGIDILEVERMARSLTRTPRFACSVFTESEMDYCESATNVKVKAQRYAARFAAKEAFLKALGTGLRDGISWHDITINRNSLGRPSIKLSGEAQAKTETLSINSIHLSLTHSREYAAAVVILEQFDQLR